MRFAEPAVSVLADARFLDVVMAALAALEAARVAGVTDIIPGYASLLIIYNPTETTPDELEGWVARSLLTVEHQPRAASSRVEIPVLYHPRVAPDLAELANEKNLSIAELIVSRAGRPARIRVAGGGHSRRAPIRRRRLRRSWLR